MFLLRHFDDFDAMWDLVRRSLMLKDYKGNYAVFFFISIIKKETIKRAVLICYCQRACFCLKKMCGSTGFEMTNPGRVGVVEKLNCPAVSLRDFS
jgi:hypothetical protein